MPLCHMRNNFKIYETLYCKRARCNSVFYNVFEESNKYGGTGKGKVV